MYKRILQFTTLLIIILISSLSFAKQIVSEDEVIDRVLVYAPDTLMAREDLGVAEAGIMASKSAFDTYLGLDADHLQDEFKRSSDFFGQRQDTTNWNVGLGKKLPSGTSLGIDWENQRTKLFGVPNIGGTDIFPRGSTFESILRFSVRQPIMKNVGGIVDRGEVNKAKKAYNSADYLTRYKIAGITYQALSIYWKWVLAYSNMSSWYRSVRDAQDFLNATLERKRLGTVEETDVLAARANLIQRKNELIEMKRLAKSLEKDLKVLLAYSADQEIVPKNRYPRQLHLVDKNRHDSIAYALDNRWDYLAQKEEVERQNINVVQTKNKRWPEMDLFASFALNELDTNYTETLKDVDSPSYTFGMTFSMPLENKLSRSQYKQAKHEKSKALIQLKKMENDISNTITELFKRLEYNKNLLNNSQKREKLQKEKLYQELNKYKMGRSRSDLIVRYQDDAVYSEIATLKIWDVYIENILDIKLAKNTLIYLDE